MNMFYWIVIIVIVVLLSWTPMDDTDKSQFSRSGLTLYTDNKTKLQYIKAGMFGNLIPRLDANGKHMKKDE